MIKPLTSLRFFFALMVFLSHLDFLLQSQNETSRWIFKHIFFEGYIGVSFFFILSGFILAYKYQNALLTGKKTPQYFWRARFARIYPLHLLTLFISIPLVINEFWADKIKFIVKFFIQLTLTQSYFPQPDIHYSFNAPSWSISDESFFYLLFPLLVLLLLKSVKKLYYSLLILITSLLVLLFVLPEEWHHFVFYIFPPVRLVDFMIGIGLYNLYIYFNKHYKHLNFARLEWVALLIFIVFFSFHEQVPLGARYASYYWIPMSLIIFVFAFQQGKISKLLSRKYLFIAGEISYGFYMFHQLVLRYFTKYFPVLMQSEVLFITTVFIVALLLSYYSYKYYETPLNRYIRKA